MVNPHHCAVNMAVTFGRQAGQVVIGYFSMLDVWVRAFTWDVVEQFDLASYSYSFTKHKKNSRPLISCRDFNELVSIYRNSLAQDLSYTVIINC